MESVTDSSDIRHECFEEHWQSMSMRATVVARPQIGRKT